MKSYWGVDHGEVSKSFIPGKGWVPAAKAGKKALRGAQGAHAKARGVTQLDRMKQKMISDTGQHIMSTTKPHSTVGLGRGMTAQRRESNHMPPGVEAYAAMSGKNRFLVTKPNADQKFVNHEIAHLSPKGRRPHKMADFSLDPGKAMREEARADMAGGMSFRGAPSLRQANIAALKGNEVNYSGYAQAAGDRSAASTLRSMNKPQDQMNMAQLKASGFKNPPEMSRSKMFNQKSLGGYRKVQDSIDAGQGVNHRIGARTHNALHRAPDIAIPVASAAAIGAVAESERRKFRAAANPPQNQL